jgi:hypothetical protein
MEIFNIEKQSSSKSIKQSSVTLYVTLKMVIVVRSVNIRSREEGSRASFSAKTLIIN